MRHYSTAQRIYVAHFPLRREPDLESFSRPVEAHVAVQQGHLAIAAGRNGQMEHFGGKR
jgi:hypothetical protein